MVRQEEQRIVAAHESRELHNFAYYRSKFALSKNLQQAGVAIVVLIARSNRLPDLVPLIPNVRTVLNTITPGEVSEVGGSR